MFMMNDEWTKEIRSKKDELFTDNGPWMMARDRYENNGEKFPESSDGTRKASAGFPYSRKEDWMFLMNDQWDSD